MTLTRRGRLVLIVLFGLVVGAAMQIGDPGLPPCPLHQPAHERCAP